MIGRAVQCSLVIAAYCYCPVGFLHIQYTLIAERMLLIMIRLTATIFVSKLHIRPKVLAINVTLDKRSWGNLRAPPFLFYFFYLFLKRNTYVSFGIRRWCVTSCVWSNSPWDMWCFLSGTGHWSFDTHVLSANFLMSSTCIFGPLKGLSS